MQFAAAGPAELVEVLVEDAAGVATAAGLSEEAPTSAAGRSFRRYVGQNFAAAGGISVVAPTGVSSAFGLVSVILIASSVLMVGALVVALRRGSAA
jgi:hypothetical protein